MSSSCDELRGSTVTVRELVWLLMNKVRSADDEEELAVKRPGLSGGLGCQEAWAMVNRAGLCVSQSDSGTGGAAPAESGMKAECRGRPARQQDEIILWRLDFQGIGEPQS